MRRCKLGYVCQSMTAVIFQLGKIFENPWGRGNALNMRNLITGHVEVPGKSFYFGLGLFKGWKLYKNHFLHQQGLR